MNCLVHNILSADDCFMTYLHISIILFRYGIYIFRLHLQVARFFNRRLSTIQSLWEKFQTTGTVRDRPKRAKQRVTTHHQDRLIQVSHLRNRFKTTLATARETLGRYGRSVSRKTVTRRLKEVGLRARRPRIGIVLTERHRNTRLA